MEGCKLAMADREAWYGDAAPVPLAELLSEPYNAARRALIGEKASYELRPGAPGGRPPLLSPHALTVLGDTAGAPGAGEPTVSRDGATRGTPATSTSSTAGATWSPPPRAAAGSSPTRSSPSWASRWAPGSR
ncbi:hypothetical protein ACFQ60_39065 [Streptomyces zhihengii]